MLQPCLLCLQGPRKVSRSPNNYGKWCFCVLALFDTDHGLGLRSKTLLPQVSLKHCMEWSLLISSQRRPSRPHQVRQIPGASQSQSARHSCVKTPRGV